MDYNNLLDKETAEFCEYFLDTIPYESILLLPFIKRVAIIISSYYYLRCVVYILTLRKWLRLRMMPLMLFAMALSVGL